MNAHPFAAIAASCILAALGCKGSGSAPGATTGSTEDLPLLRSADLVYQGTVCGPNVKGGEN